MPYSFSVLTVFPDLVKSAFQQGVVAQALKKNLLKLDCFTPRDFATDVHRTVDDRPFGGGDGMVLLAETLEKCWSFAKDQGAVGPVVYLTPQGRRMDDQWVKEKASAPGMTLVCGRYGGIDQRWINRHVEEEVSIGDYVISGGELAAAVVIDAVARQIPGVLGHQDSARKDSFFEGRLEAPVFSRPREWAGQEVPEALLSGHHAQIEKWQLMVGLLVTLKKRPDLWHTLDLSADRRRDLKKFWDALPAGERQALGFGSWEGRELLHGIEGLNG